MLNAPETLGEQDRIYLQAALVLAKQAGEMGEIPVGAVLVRNGQILSQAHNRREIDHSATAHAEILCIEQACKALGHWRLSDCTLYVTLEPCPMCAGAILNARIGRVVYALPDAKSGCFGSVMQMDAFPFNHKPKIASGLMQQEVRDLMQDFFRARRDKTASERKNG